MGGRARHSFPAPVELPSPLHISGVGAREGREAEEAVAHRPDRIVGEAVLDDLRVRTPGEGDDRQRVTAVGHACSTLREPGAGERVGPILVARGVGGVRRSREDGRGIGAPAHGRVVGQLPCPRAHFDQVAAHDRVEEGRDQSGRVVDEPALPRRPPCDAQVRQLAAQHGVGLGLAVSGDRRLEPATQFDRPPDQPPRGGLRLARGGEAVEPERAQRLQHAVAGASAEGHLDHGRVDEPGQETRGVARDTEIGGEPLGGVQVDAVDEHREVTKQPLLVGGQQPVGPF